MRRSTVPRPTLGQTRLLPRSGIGVDGEWLVVGSSNDSIACLDARLLNRIELGASQGLLLVLGDVEVELGVADGPEAAQVIVNLLAPYTRDAQIIRPEIYQNAKRRMCAQGKGKSEVLARRELEYALLVDNDVVYLSDGHLRVGEVKFRFAEVREYALRGANLPLPDGRALHAALALLLMAAEVRAGTGEDLALLSTRIADYEARPRSPDEEPAGACRERARGREAAPHHHRRSGVRGAAPTPPQPFVPRFGAALLAARQPSTAGRRAFQIAVGILALIISGRLIPIGSVWLAILGSITTLLGYRRPFARRCGLLIASGAAVLLALQAVAYGRPASLWLFGAIAAGALAHVKRPTNVSMLRIILTNGRNAAVSAAIGLAGVVAMQLTLHYVSEHHVELVRSWTFQIGEVRVWVEDVALLGPTQLAVLFVLLIAAAILVPSLHLIRYYRLIATATAHGLLALTVAASFVFFGSSYSRSAEWIARLEVAREDLGAIDNSHEEIVKHAAVEQVFRKLDPQIRTRMVVLAQEIRQHPDCTEIQKRIVEQLVSGSSVEQLTSYVDSARSRLDEMETTDELRSSRERIERTRQQLERDEAPSRVDLAALRIERSRAEARRQETRAAVVELITELTIPGFAQPLIGDLAQRMTQRISIHGRVPAADHASAASALQQVSREPPRIYSDYVFGDFPARRRDDDHELTEVHAYIANVVRMTSEKIIEERRIVETAAAESRSRASQSGRSYQGVREVEGGHGKSIGGGKSRSSGGSRFGVRGGGTLVTA